WCDLSFDNYCVTVVSGDAIASGGRGAVLRRTAPPRGSIPGSGSPARGCRPFPARRPGRLRTRALRLSSARPGRRSRLRRSPRTGSRRVRGSRSLQPRRVLTNRGERVRVSLTGLDLAVELLEQLTELPEVLARLAAGVGVLDRVGLDLVGLLLLVLEHPVRHGHLSLVAWRRGLGGVLGLDGLELLRLALRELLLLVRHDLGVLFPYRL